MHFAKRLMVVVLVCMFITYCQRGEGTPIDNAGNDSAINHPAIPVDSCSKCIILAEQSQHRIAIVDIDQQKIIWEWQAGLSNVEPEHVKWFTNPSDAKAVYDNKYILTTASGGGVALIRIAGKKTVFYAFAGGNTHSAELLPDGNIVAASSTGNYLTVFQVDTTVAAGNVHSIQIPIAFGHNVVWDAKNKLLWSAAMNHIKSFHYNFNCERPALELVDSIPIPGTEAHDLFPEYGTDTLWLTNTTNVYKLDVASRHIIEAPGLQKNIKSVSSGPSGFPTILIRPKEQWWTDEIIDTMGNSVFWQAGLKIYKARWLLPCQFSYPSGSSFKQCN